MRSPCGPLVPILTDFYGKIPAAMLLSFLVAFVRPHSGIPERVPVRISAWVSARVSAVVSVRVAARNWCQMSLEHSFIANKDPNSIGYHIDGLRALSTDCGIESSVECRARDQRTM